MIDIAQLREALARILDNFQMSSEVGIPIVRESEWEVAFKAARELLTIREAGALIITPDEDGKWPAWALVPTYLIERNEEGRPSLVMMPVDKYLDALRDAMSDGET